MLDDIFSLGIAYLTFTVYWANLADNSDVIFPRKQDEAFYANCLCLKCRNLFSGENKKTFQNVVSENITQHVVLITCIYRIRPNYRTGRLGVSKLLVKLVNYVSTCTY